METKSPFGPILSVLLAIPLALLYAVLSILLAPVVACAWATGKPTNVPYPFVPLQVIVGHRGRIWVGGSSQRMGRVELGREPSGPQGASRFEKFSERARRVLSLAQGEAQRLSHNYIGTEHLLIGIMREGEGVAAGVLKSLGVSVDNVRAETIRILNGGNDTTYES